MAHSSLLGGHLGTKKTKAMVNRHFTWPGLGKDVATWCKACERCQLTAKHSSKVAPLHPLPVITEPFHKLAFDLVGPLPRTKRGHKFILTTMDYGTKFPDAVPFRKVDAETVATAMVDIFSRYGLPREILTDQGTVFTSSLMCQLCQLLQITRVKTSPYHPQTDGMLERWHATLKGMLRKARDLGKEWDDLLPYCLFAYRSAPHTNTGIAPFELLFGRNIRGPLEVLKSGWMGGEIAEKSIVGWVAGLKKKLQATAAIVEQKELEAKTRMKKSYDKRATLISFKPGDMVLMRIPQLQAKLQDTWDGPFEVLSQVSPVTYVIAVPNRRKRKKTVHVNMLKYWTTPDASVLSILLLHDEEDEEIVSTVKDDEHPLTEQQRHQLNQTLLQWEKTLNPEPGKVSTTVHVINTGSSSPTIVPQYRIAPAWKEPLRDELRSMAKTGIIHPSLSPWSSPVLPVKKKDGTIRVCVIRVCVDFRKLNAATNPTRMKCLALMTSLINWGRQKFCQNWISPKVFIKSPSILMT